MVFNENKNRLEIWVDNKEKDLYRNLPEYTEAVSKYKNTHEICVYVGGTLPVVPTISALLDAQNFTA